MADDGVLRLGADAKAPNPGYLKLLEEFGYPHDMAVRALLAVKNESLNHAIEWLDQHRDDHDTFVDTVVVEEHRPNLGPIQTEPKTSATTANAILNDDLRADGISRSKLEAGRKEHAEFKRQKAMQEERDRLKKKQEDARIVREKYAREKAEKLRLKQEEAARKANPNAQSNNSNTSTTTTTGPSAPKVSKVDTGDPSKIDVVIQVRVPNRPPIVIKGLNGASTLADLYGKVDAECKLQKAFVLTIPFPPPPVHLSRDNKTQMAETLSQLGLCPRAALVVTEQESLGKVSPFLSSPFFHSSFFKRLWKDMVLSTTTITTIITTTIVKRKKMHLL